MNKKILVVDDDTSILEVLTEVLTFHDFEVVPLSPGDKVLEAISQHNPDLILMDVMLSGMDGRTICRAIRAVESTKHIPVILISANQDAASCLGEYGAPDDFVAKPFDMNDLIGKIEDQLKSEARGTESEA